MEAIVHSDQFSVAKRINSLGLDVANLLETVRAAFIARAACTDLDPRYYPGLTMHAVAVRQLRIQLIPRGWTRCDDGNYSLTIAPDESLAIGVATGDEFTGDLRGCPSTQSRKGARTFDAVAINNRQLGFDFVFPDGYEPPMRENPDRTTWLLLMHLGPGVVQAELSHPLGIDDANRVSGWRERIILPSIEVDPTETVDTEEDDCVEFDVPVDRRA